MSYKTLTVVNLPFLDEGKGKRVEPGGTITKAELAEAQQTEDDVKALLESGAITEDMSAEVHPAHFEVSADRYGNPVVLHPETGEHVDPVSRGGEKHVVEFLDQHRRLVREVERLTTKARKEAGRASAGE